MNMFQVPTTIAEHANATPDGLLGAISRVSKVVRDTIAATEYGCQMYGDRYAQSRGKYNLGIIRAGLLLLERLIDGDLDGIPVVSLESDTDIRESLRTTTTSISSNHTTH